MTNKEFKKYMLEHRPFAEEEKRFFEKIKDLKKKLEVYQNYYISGRPSSEYMNVVLNKYELDFLVEVLKEVFENGK